MSCWVIISQIFPYLNTNRMTMCGQRVMEDFQLPAGFLIEFLCGKLVSCIGNLLLSSLPPLNSCWFPHLFCLWEACARRKSVVKPAEN